MNGVGSTSFFGYEGLRIILSGLIGAGLIWAAADTLVDADFLDGLTTSLVVGVVVGLTLYFLQLPDRSPSSREPDPKSLFAAAMNLNPDAYETDNKYFVTFDTLLPHGLRERSQYFHQIYRIGFELVLLSTVATQVVWLFYPHAHLVDRPVPAVVFIGVVAALGIITWVPVHDAVRRQARRRRQRNTPELRDGVREIFGEVVSELGGGWVIGVVLIVLGSTVLDGVPLVKETVIGYLLLFWLRLHLLGLPGQHRPRLLRHPVAAFVQSHSRRSATVLSRYGAYALVTTGGLARITDFESGYALDSAFLLTQDLGLWIVGALVIAGVVAARGHEVGFAATNYQQGTWFNDNTHRIEQVNRHGDPACWM